MRSNSRNELCGLKKSGNLVGPAKIGWVEVKEKGKRLEYQKQIFRALRGQGYKSNFFDMKTGEEYWISGCRKEVEMLYITPMWKSMKMLWKNTG